MTRKRQISNPRHIFLDTSTVQDQGFALLPLGEALRGGRSSCGCAYWICSELLSGLKFFEGQIPVFPMGA